MSSFELIRNIFIILYPVSWLVFGLIIITAPKNVEEKKALEELNWVGWAAIIIMYGLLGPFLLIGLPFGYLYSKLRNKLGGDRGEARA